MREAAADERARSVQAESQLDLDRREALAYLERERVKLEGGPSHIFHQVGVTASRLRSDDSV